MIAKKGPELEMAVKKFNGFSKGQIARFRKMIRQQVKLDEIYFRECAIAEFRNKIVEEVKLEGMLEGKIQGRIETAKNAVRMGMPLLTIMELTGLPEKEIQLIIDANTVD